MTDTALPVGVSDDRDRRTAAERWRDLSRPARIALSLVAAVVAVELALALIGGVAGSPVAGDPDSSTFGTGPGGTAALAQLLDARGLRVVRSTQPLSSLAPSPDTTVFVIDADPSSWTSGDTAGVTRVLDAGGHLVVAGQPPAQGLLAQAFGPGTTPRWSSRPAGDAHAVGTSVVVAGVGPVSSGFEGSVGPVGHARVVVAGTLPLAVVSPAATATAGRPRAVLVASSIPFTNAALDQNDNAAFALNLAGPAGGTVVFDEYDHGYGRTASGLSGLPPWWKWGLVVALVAVLVWLLSAARRFGPVEAATRRLIPPRVAYADAMATALASLPPDRVVETVLPLRDEARTLLCRRLALPYATGDAAVAEAAVAARVPEYVVAAALGRPGSPAEAVAVGRAMAWLSMTTNPSATNGTKGRT